MSRIFICYRREEDEFAVQFLCTQLTATFGGENVFRDLGSLHGGDKWKEVLETRVRECEVMLVLIGPHWLTLRGAGSRRRIDMDNDWVRFEIETALHSEVRVIPVLLQQAQHATTMPGVADLPESIRELNDCHAVTLRAGDFMNDVQKLINDLQAHESQLADIKRTLETYESLVDGGEWVRAKSFLDEALVTVGSRRAGHKLLARRQPAAKLLHTAAKAFERNDFAEAHELLGQIPEPTPGMLASLQFAAIGMELGSGALTAERVRSVRNDMTQIARGGETVPGRNELLTILDRHEQRADYDAAVEHYRAGRFITAQQHFERVQAHPDAAQWLARIAIWSQVFEALRDRRWSDARAHLRGLHEEDPARITAVRQWCILTDKFLPALTRMAEGGRLDEPAVPSEVAQSSPYAVLHVSPSLPHAKALDLFYEHPNEKASCDALRVPETRLLVDFGTYAVRNPHAAANIIARYFSFAADATLDDFLGNILRVFSDAGASIGTMSQHLFKAIESALGEDAGILFALQCNHEVAIQRFLEAARRNPADHMSLHHLGLAACAKAHVDPAADTLAETWNLVCVAWGAVFADDRFWNMWWAQVRKTYPITENQKVQEARARLERFWLDELKTVEGLGEDSADAFALEARSSRAVAALKGIPLGPTKRERAIAGRRGLGALNLDRQFQSLVASFTTADVEQESAQRMVCIAFSRLALPHSLFEAGRHADALAALQRIDPAPRELGAADAGFAFLPSDVGPRLFRETHARLLCNASLELAKAGISRSPMDLDAAMEHWKAALAAAARCNAVEETREQIRNAVVGRSQWLRSAKGTSQERLSYGDDAVRLVEEAERQRGWDNDERVLLNELVESLLDRAVYVSNEFDMEKMARLDALAAYRLRPSYLRAIEVLCMASMFYARQLASEGKHDVAADLVAEVLTVLDLGETYFPGHQTLTKIRDGALEFRGLITDQDEETLDRIFKSLGEVARCAEAEPDNPLLEEAKQQQKEENYERATDLYWQFLEANPEDQEARGRMCHSYRLWLYELRENGRIAEKNRVLDIARARCADSLQLRDIFEAEAELEDDEGDEA